MKRHPIKCLNVKLPVALTQRVDHLEPTAVTYLTSSEHPEGIIIMTYWFTNEIVSTKQLRWVGDIKSVIKSIFPECSIDVECPSTLRPQSGLTYSLKAISVAWNKSSQLYFKIEPTPKRMPKLTPLICTGKSSWNLSKSLYLYGVRLHYYHVLTIEYMKVASNLYNKYLPNGKVSLKIQEKTAVDVYTKLKDEIASNPHSFPQKLSKEEYERVKRQQAQHLQHGNRIKRDHSIHLVQQALKEPTVYKKNGTVNAAAVSNHSGLNIRTIRAVLAEISAT